MWPGKISARASAISAWCAFPSRCRRASDGSPACSRSALRLGQSDNSWKTQRMPSPCALAGLIGLDDLGPRPGNRRDPAWTTPMRIFMSVLLPAPLWPISPRYSPAVELEIDLPQGLDRPKRFAEAPQERREADVASLPSPPRWARSHPLLRHLRLRQVAALLACEIGVDQLDRVIPGIARAWPRFRPAWPPARRPACFPGSPGAGR